MRIGERRTKGEGGRLEDSVNWGDVAQITPHFVIFARWVNVGAIGDTLPYTAVLRVLRSVSAPKN